MENREKLEIPVIAFTAVTLLDTTTSGKQCECEGNTCLKDEGTIAQACHTNCFQ